MNLDEELEKTNDITKTWRVHINEKMSENLKKAIKHRNNENTEEIEIDDMGAIDSIEDGIVKLEILDESMIEIKENEFKYGIEEGDVINLKLTYKEGKLNKIEILDKNEEEKMLRVKMIREKMKRLRDKH